MAAFRALLLAAVAAVVAMAQNTRNAVPCTWETLPSRPTSIAGSALAGIPLTYGFANPPCGSLAVQCFSGSSLIFDWSSSSSSMSVPVVPITSGSCTCTCGSNSPACTVYVYTTP